MERACACGKAANAIVISALYKCAGEAGLSAGILESQALQVVTGLNYVSAPSDYDLIVQGEVSAIAAFAKTVAGLGRELGFVADMEARIPFGNGFLDVKLEELLSQSKYVMGKSMSEERMPHEMNMFTPAEIVQNYAKTGKAKAEKSISNLLLLGILAGLFVACGAAVSNTAVHSLTNVSAARLASGLVFPIGIGMIMLMGAELFTGNTMIFISVLSRQTTLAKMLRNWGIVYAGNFIGAVSLAAACAWFGQFNYSSGGLAVYSIKIAVAKCEIPFMNAVVMGVLCNVLVCTGVLCGLSSKDTIGRIAGGYIPVALFVICGFEHCVASMYYVPAGIFAMRVSEYAELAAQAGIHTGALTWGNFIVHNLLPVTLGNILGGVGVSALMWFCNPRSTKDLLAVSKKESRDDKSHAARAS